MNVRPLRYGRRRSAHVSMLTSARRGARRFNVQPELNALVAVVAVALLREYLAWRERRERKRGTRRTRQSDDYVRRGERDLSGGE